MAVNVNGKSLETDEEGYLLDPSEWDEGVAHKIAEGDSSNDGRTLERG